MTTRAGSERLVLAVPSKGRLMEATGEIFAAAGLTLRRTGDARGYRGEIAELPDIDVAFVSASEIAQYAFCARAWWLARVAGYRSTNIAAMKQGTMRHRAHGRRVAETYLLRRVGLSLLAMGILALVAWLLGAAS